MAAEEKAHIAEGAEADEELQAWVNMTSGGSLLPSRSCY